MPTEQELERAAELLRAGQLVGIPTETVYGLAANALDAVAVRRIYEMKGRPSTSPLIVHVATLEMARELTREWPETATRLAERYWPGPLTVVLPKRAIVPDEVTAGLDTVGIRMPSHPVALEIIRRAGIPLAAPSANRFTQLSPTTAAHVKQALGGDLMVLDGGPCDVGIESTVVSVRADAITLLRPGMIAKADIQAVAGVLVVEAGAVSGAHPSPGMHERHYSPRTPVYLYEGGKLPPGRGVYLQLQRSAEAEQVIEMPRDPQGYAQRLYQVLHEADALSLDWIAVEMPPDSEEWRGILDRLKRAK